MGNLQITQHLDRTITKEWIASPVLDTEGNEVRDENNNIVMDTPPDGVLN